MISKEWINKTILKSHIWSPTFGWSKRDLPTTKLWFQLKYIFLQNHEKHSVVYILASRRNNDDAVLATSTNRSLRRLEYNKNKYSPIQEKTTHRRHHFFFLTDHRVHLYRRSTQPRRNSRVVDISWFHDSTVYAQGFWAIDFPVIMFFRQS